ncbi:MAG: histidine--tRNA ligase [Dehalococcoidales bacterium]|nr:histidine--tRNA ligase [Dehalococcoidales bacterium]
MYQAPRGTVDILPEEQAYWRYIEQKAAGVSRLYGYQRIDTPTFEDTGLFTRSVGQGTDIVEKEMYTFKDKGDNLITLRPEGTASVCRAYLEHGMSNLPQPVKMFYFADIFRYERPQAGRLRQHHQFGCEAIGEGDPSLDAEVIDMAWRFFTSLGLQNLSLVLNSIGCKQCRPEYIRILKEYYVKQAPELCPDCSTRLERNTLRLLDCKKPSCQKIADAAPRSADHLCPDCAAHFAGLQKYLHLLAIPFAVNHRLVRGLDYYTRTVFEIQPQDAGGQSTIGGGGRYDNLIEELGGKPTPAIGFATGIERIILNLKKQSIAVPPLPAPQVYLACLGEAAREAGIRLGAELRGAGTGVVVATGIRSLKAQLRQANSLGVRFTVILGDEEVKAGTATVRDMATSEQQTIKLAELAGVLKKAAW